MARSIYLINPLAEIPGYFGADVFQHLGFKPAQAIADAAIATVAALVPDDFYVRLCDEHVSEIDFDSKADIIGITGKVTQASRMIQVAAEFRRRGRTVMIGGPFASLSPEEMRPHCDILVRGELEGIAGDLFDDLRRGDWQEEYVGDRPDLSTSPVPRWDLYPNDRTLVGCVQTSRGCPFECEFCDVIQYLGRKQRHKSVEQILEELDVLYGYGYRAVLLADDNFTVYRKRAKGLLRALREWNNNRPDGPVAFATQVSIDAAKDDEILRLCAEAGMVWVFVGIETPNVESLKESKKRQNVGVDLEAQIQRFLDYGIAVTGGMIVGFDADKLDIFDIQYDFAMSTPIPIFSLGALVAPAATPLYDRMRDAGRLVEGGSEVAATPWDTNILPAQMSREQLLEGLRWLCNRLYDPDAFAERVVQTIDKLGPQRGPFGKSRTSPSELRAIDREGVGLLKKLIRQGPAERRMWKTISAAMLAKPGSQGLVMSVLFRYAQIRCLYEQGHFWEPKLAEIPTFIADGEALEAGSNLASLAHG